MSQLGALAGDIASPRMRWGARDDRNRINVVNRELQAVGIDPAEMARILQSTGAIVAGGFALRSTFVNEPWVGGDIDIWACQNQERWLDAAEPFANLLWRAGYTTHNRQSAANSKYDRLRTQVQVIHSFRKPNSNDNVQVMVLAETGLRPSEIVRQFDLNVCEVFWDGVQVRAMPGTALSETLEFTVAALKQTPLEWGRTWRRVGKYVKRGFKADLPVMFGNCAQSMARFFQQSMDRSRSRHWAQPDMYTFLRNARGALVAFDELFSDAYQVILGQYDDRNGLVLGAWRGGSNGTEYRVLLRRSDQTEPLGSWTLCTSTRETSMQPFTLHPVFSRELTREEREQLSQEENTLLETLENERLAGLRAGEASRFAELLEDDNPRRLDWPVPPSVAEPPDTDDADTLPALICHDSVLLMEGNPQSLIQYIATAPEDNIFVILPPLTARERYGEQAVCYTRSALTTFLADESSRFFPCNNERRIDVRSEFIKVPVGEWTAFVPRRDVEYVVNQTQVVMFQLRPAMEHNVQVVIPFTASYAYAVNGEMVSADHCQQGTEKRIYRLRGVRRTT